MMVELYELLPQMRYQGKYPHSVISPQDTQQHTPQPNGADEEKKTESLKTENGTPRKESETPNPIASSPPKSSMRESGSAGGKRDVSPATIHRDRSPQLLNSSRPPSPTRDADRYERRGSNSRTRHRGNYESYYSPSRGRDGRRDSYVPRRVDTYIPPDRKRSFGPDSPSGREKRRRSEDDGEISEGEIR